MLPRWKFFVKNSSGTKSSARLSRRCCWQEWRSSWRSHSRSSRSLDRHRQLAAGRQLSLEILLVHDGGRRGADARAGRSAGFRAPWRVSAESRRSSRSVLGQGGNAGNLDQAMGGLLLGAAKGRKFMNFVDDNYGRIAGQPAAVAQEVAGDGKRRGMAQPSGNYRSFSELTSQGTAPLDAAAVVISHPRP
jgi:hypothetical protein